MSQRTYSIIPLAAAALTLFTAGACKTVVLPGNDSGDETEGTEGTDSATGPGAGSTDGGTDGMAGSANCGELSAKTLDILDVNCAKCHGPDSAALGSINYITNLDALIKNGKVEPGEPNNSALYRRMAATMAPMPPESETQRPSEDDLRVVEQWIGECAGVTGCSDNPWVTRSAVIDMIRADLLNTQEISADARPFIRYFSLVHLYNYGWCSDQIDIYRHALSKLVNSLSNEIKVVAPTPIDPDNLIFRIDIRDYDWDAPGNVLDPTVGSVTETFKDTWELIAAKDPYAIEFIGDSAEDVKQATGTKFFLLQADAFVEVAAQPPLYHDVLRIPLTRQELEASFGIDVEANIQEEIDTNPNRVARGAFHDSGVSENHRVIERHDFPNASNRSYWISYDFGSNAGDANVFVDPFDFKEDGSEIIYNLPNGLQGYMIVDEFGGRIDDAPIQIVQDKNAPDGVVRNGKSCMGCHNVGMINKDDDLRWEVDENLGEGDFDDNELDAIRALYPTRDDFNILFSLDADRFNLAVKAAGVPLGGDKEPIVTVFNAFDEDVALRRAAAELWTTESTLREKLGQLSPDLDNLGKNQTGVRRDVFSAAFADAICRLKVGRTKACP
ncbi:c-type cytochrome domain-containing protein [Nannocystis pusilla]|uniref:c-type cytochrome domain-containing protein n=1 Tax=Nannocystis pusilla TaxID=889268 RepID=UPI003B778AFC